LITIGQRQGLLSGHSQSERDHRHVLIRRHYQESALFHFFNAWIDAAHFGADVQRVMALRIMRLASGGPDAATEAQQMISEKVSAFGEAQMAIFTTLMAGQSLEAAAARAYAPYRRCVRANSRRLGN
jgi:hypothetical protein